MCFYFKKITGDSVEFFYSKFCSGLAISDNEDANTIFYSLTPAL